MTHITIEKEKLEKVLAALEKHGVAPKDWACKECVPFSDILKDGFQCKYHEAIAVCKQALAAQPAHVQDAEGENMAVRSFLMLYGQAGLTVGQMRKHMAMSGFKSWPAWVDAEPDGAHLTKAGAQLWIRHLFALEATPPAAPVQEPDYKALYEKAAQQYNELAALVEQPAPVQEPVAWTDLLKQAEEVVRSKSLWKKYIDGTPLANDIAVWMASFAQEHTTPPAQPATVQECFWRREGYKECPAAQPAVPDAFGTREGEHPEYIQGWNDCRAEMLKGGTE
jgi:hypothetical protein